MTTEYASPDELVKLLKDPSLKAGRDFLVIDVRSDDYHGGHIPGAVNIPSHQFLHNVAAQVSQFKDTPVLYFHCALSQVRGPKCAARYAAELVSLGKSETQSIKILRGGFGGWQEMYRDDPELVEDYIKKVWEAGW
ncbi:hypothetical protein BASA50_001832 [Batrachochytrium salamandrivorans]|uniref:Rhodanese domain-containing protein n=1 Tax=Batrachochytrium salamandrivorans TaxID=1357716 RepID=A0ABQ8FN55_9FUNG|nr:hypothetical protein BASA62_009061 [Batrachochytrium salamandrivorans]KAH6566723.1 hypothetical protein BASA60_009335 [Batrachochytrium salamandrivorans]KAH6601153.1 hypothetical protein BASA50_001832 [Batrachochytrium salamandrivorans]KAH9252755.1 hypothetical protein BASA81_009264 [Batrachochytrium salamandrivorans]KAH9274988.1 hypothetical protein BASA83_002700 [Batrachochytrium salamandrivorans]